MSDSQKSELILKTKIFYFNRCVTLLSIFAREAAISLNCASVTGHNISLEDGDTADLNRFRIHSGNECSQIPLGAEHGEMRILTFVELKSLIEQGKTDNIPNNKIIPNISNVSSSCMSCTTCCPDFLNHSRTAFPVNQPQHCGESPGNSQDNRDTHDRSHTWAISYTELPQPLLTLITKAPSVGEKTCSLIFLTSGSRNES
ncbi:hypothetical protein JVT61DRAFT_8165 [Boletus reticuloceps]|uniref:Uncharacterized protein n=1 Tax=Boletus reticuloceps TaxID=495285 RepID=A0A8I2YZU6_9AGAM|nr:hypothetical protein JVT61DRAFT_8165 [Boletus reticuloceps]